MTDPLHVHQDGRVHRLTLNRPSSGNAVDQDLADAFAVAVRSLTDEPEPQIVVLTAAGTQFCAGGDVHAVATADDPAAYLRRLATTMHDALIALRESPHTVVAAVHGAAAGAGLALVLNADLVVAADTAVFLSAYAAVGLTPDCGVSYLLPRVIGPRRAAELAITGRVLDADTAQDWGLVNDVVPAEELGPAVHALVARLSEGSSHAPSRTLALMRREDLGLAAQLEAELDGLAAQIASPDTITRMERFLNRSQEKNAR